MRLDTCHVFAAGHDLTGPSGMDQTLDLLVGTVGRDRLKLIHANDSQDVAGAHKDRHENTAPVTSGRNRSAR